MYRISLLLHAINAIEVCVNTDVVVRVLFCVKIGKSGK